MVKFNFSHLLLSPLAFLLSATKTLAHDPSKTDLVCDYDPTVENQVCKFELTISESLTNTAQIDGAGRRYPIDFQRGNKATFGTNKHYEKGAAAAYARMDSKQDITKNLTNVIYGDGIEEKTVITVNGQSPGPSIYVPEGAFVAITVINKMAERATTLHWHGIKQENSWFYDGSSVSQCPINPKTSFTYRFLAKPAGVQWYHSHFAKQRMEGLFGLLIVGRQNYNLKPVMIHEFSSLSSSESANEFMYLGGGSFSGTDDLYQRWYRQDGSELNAANYDTTMINGRGRRNKDLFENPRDKSFVPYEIIESNTKNGINEKTQLAIGNFGGEYGHEFSVSGHRLIIIEADGSQIEPITVDFIQLTPGERYVVELEKIGKKENFGYGDHEIPKKKQTHTFAIRVDTLAVFGLASREKWIEILEAGKTVNLIQESGGVKSFYKLSKTEKLTKSAFAYFTYMKNTKKLTDNKYKYLFEEDKDMRCTAEKKCLVLNCGFKKYHESVRPNIKCLDLTDLQSTEEELTASDLIGINSDSSSNEITTMIMSFRLGGSINGIRFHHPMPPLSQSDGFAKSPKCEGKLTFGDFCTKIYKFDLNSRHKFLLLSGDQSGWDPMHTFHLHGHKMKVLATGYSIKNSTTGIVEKFEQPHNENDLVLNFERASYDTWEYQVMTGAYLKNEAKTLSKKSVADGPMKDTIAVPSGGWTLVEINFNNPGLFHFHCHMTTHDMEGQAAIFQVGNVIPFPLKKDNWPKCGNFGPGIEGSDFVEFMGNLVEFPVLTLN